MKKWVHIESTSTIDQQDERCEMEMAEDPEAAVVMELRQKKADLENQCREMEEKLLEQRMDNAFRKYQDDLREEINKFYGALMSAYGKNLATEKPVVEARDSLQKLCCTEQYMGYTRCVGTDFVECVGRSLLCGQVPECQFMCTKTNNSVDDPILGHVVDVVYEISMPVIAKSEKLDNNDNLVLIGVTPGILMSAVPVNITVKKEKIDASQNTSTQQSQFESPVFRNKAPEMGESTGGDVKEGNSENKEHDDEELSEEQKLDVVNSSQDLIPSALKKSRKLARPRKKRRLPLWLPLNDHCGQGLQLKMLGNDFF